MTLIQYQRRAGVVNSRVLLIDTDSHNNHLTPTQALKELVQLVQVSARQRGHPFNNVLELLLSPDDDGDDDQSAQLSPEEQLLHNLVNLAVTIR